jgi:hypothetical protein
MTRRRRITRIVSAILLVVAPAACAESIDDPIETVDSGHADTAVNPDSGVTDTATNPTDTATNPTDTYVPPDDTGGGTACTASCTSDSDCTSLCSSYPGTWCCDPSSSVCYQPSTGVCSTTPPDPDGGGGGDGGSD